MKKTHKLLLAPMALCLLPLIHGCGKKADDAGAGGAGTTLNENTASGEKTSTDAKGGDAGGEMTAGWVEVEPDGKGFTSKFPKEPKHETDKDGQESWDLVDGDKEFVVITTPTAWEKGNDKLASEALDGFVKELTGSGKLVTSTEVTIGDSPGREFVITDRNGFTVRGSAQITPTALYAALAGRKGDAAGPEADAFIGAFNLVEEEAASSEGDAKEGEAKEGEAEKEAPADGAKEGESN